MPSFRAVALGTCLCMWVATAASAKEKKPAGSARPSAATKSAGARLQLVEKSDPKGFTIKVPRDTEEKRDEWSTSYKALLPPDSAQFSASVTVEALDEFTPVTNMDKAIESAAARRPRGPKPIIAEQQELPGGYLVVIGPDYGVHAVTVIRNGKEVQVKAHCSGPSAHLENLKQICLSVKPTK